MITCLPHVARTEREHDVLGHGSNFHGEQIGVPLIVRAPGVAPRRVRELVRSIDVMPTILELADVQPRDLIVQGKSLLPLMKGDADQRPSFSHGLTFDGHEDRQHSLRLGSLHWGQLRGSPVRGSRPSTRRSLGRISSSSDAR